VGSRKKKELFIDVEMYSEGIDTQDQEPGTVAKGTIIMVKGGKRKSLIETTGGCARGVSERTLESCWGESAILYSEEKGSLGKRKRKGKKAENRVLNLMRRFGKKNNSLPRKRGEKGR